MTRRTRKIRRAKMKKYLFLTVCLKFKIISYENEFKKITSSRAYGGARYKRAITVYDL